MAKKAPYDPPEPDADDMKKPPTKKRAARKGHATGRAKQQSTSMPFKGASPSPMNVARQGPHGGNPNARPRRNI